MVIILLTDVCVYASRAALTFLLQIEVRLPNNYLCIGMLEHYDLEHNVAVVSVEPFFVFCTARLDCRRRFKIGSEVVALGRCFNSGKLMATTGVLTENRGRIYREELGVSTCEITMVRRLFLFLLLCMK
jgi:hypothetical protein